MTTRYDRIRAAIPYIEIGGRAEDYELAAALREDAAEFERVEQDARNLAFHHDDAAFNDLADRIRGEKP